MTYDPSILLHNEIRFSSPVNTKVFNLETSYTDGYGRVYFHDHTFIVPTSGDVRQLDKYTVDYDEVLEIYRVYIRKHLNPQEALWNECVNSSFWDDQEADIVNGIVASSPIPVQHIRQEISNAVGEITASGIGQPVSKGAEHGEGQNSSGGSSEANSEPETPITPISPAPEHSFLAAAFDEPKLSRETAALDLALAVSKKEVSPAGFDCLNLEIYQPDHGFYKEPVDAKARNLNVNDTQVRIQVVTKYHQEGVSEVAELKQTRSSSSKRVVANVTVRSSNRYFSVPGSRAIKYGLPGPSPLSKCWEVSESAHEQPREVAIGQLPAKTVPQAVAHPYELAEPVEGNAECKLYQGGPPALGCLRALVRYGSDEEIRELWEESPLSSLDFVDEEPVASAIWEWSQMSMITQEMRASGAYVPPRLVGTDGDIEENSAYFHPTDQMDVGCRKEEPRELSLGRLPYTTSINKGKGVSGQGEPHHYNYLGRPVYFRSYTPPEVSLWASYQMDKPHFREESREGATVSEAWRLVDPYYYGGPKELLNNQGAKLREVVTGYVDKVYEPIGLWTYDRYYDHDETVPNASFEVPSIVGFAPQLQSVLHDAQDMETIMPQQCISHDAQDTETVMDDNEDYYRNTQAPEDIDQPVAYVPGEPSNDSYSESLEESFEEEDSVDFTSPSPANPGHCVNADDGTAPSLGSVWHHVLRNGHAIATALTKALQDGSSDEVISGLQRELTAIWAAKARPSFHNRDHENASNDQGSDDDEDSVDYTDTWSNPNARPGAATSHGAKGNALLAKFAEKDSNISFGDESEPEDAENEAFVPSEGLTKNSAEETSEGREFATASGTKPISEDNDESGDDKAGNNVRPGQSAYQYWPSAVSSRSQSDIARKAGGEHNASIQPVPVGCQPVPFFNAADAPTKPQQRSTIDETDHREHDSSSKSDDASECRELTVKERQQMMELDDFETDDLKKHSVNNTASEEESEGPSASSSGSLVTSEHFDSPASTHMADDSGSTGIQEPDLDRTLERIEDSDFDLSLLSDDELGKAIRAAGRLLETAEESSKLQKAKAGTGSPGNEEGSCGSSAEGLQQSGGVEGDAEGTASRAHPKSDVQKAWEHLQWMEERKEMESRVEAEEPTEPVELEAGRFVELDAQERAAEEESNLRLWLDETAAMQAEDQGDVQRQRQLRAATTAALAQYSDISEIPVTQQSFAEYFFGPCAIAIGAVIARLPFVIPC